MEKAVKISFIFAFVFLAIMGFAMMNSHQDCLFGMGSCDMNPLAMVNLHLSALSSFSSAFFYFPLVLFFLAFNSALDIAADPAKIFNRVRSKADLSLCFYDWNFSHWLKLHNNRDSFVIS